MNKTIVVGLTGHTESYQLDEDAYDELSRYLDRAAVRLEGDPDHAEVLGDLERSIGDKLTALLGSGDRVLTRSEVNGVIEQIGSVETDQDPRSEAREGGAPPRKRRLQRIRDGQQVAGVCNGLAAYSEIDVAWVRTFFVLGSLATAGILALVYIALAFILPITERREA